MVAKSVSIKDNTWDFVVVVLTGRVTLDRKYAGLSDLVNSALEEKFRKHGLIID